MRGIKLGIYKKALVGLPDWVALFAQVPDAGSSFIDLPIGETLERAACLDWDHATRRPVRDAAADAQVWTGGLCLSLHRLVMPGSADPEVWWRAADVYRKGIHLASDLGVGVVQAAGYYAYYESADPGVRQRYVDTLFDAIPHAVREGVALGIENVDENDIASVPDVMKLVELADSSWVQCYPDVGNIAGRGGESAAELQAGEGHTVALYVKGVLPDQPRRVPFGTGIADPDSAFKELARQDWSGRVMFEMWHDDTPDSLASCRVAREFTEEKTAAAGLRIVEDRSRQRCWENCANRRGRET